MSDTAPGPRAPARWATLLLWVVPALWSSNYLIARLAHGVVHPHVLALGRWTLALALLLPFVGATLTFLYIFYATLLAKTVVH